jgi:hypothetical protein
MMPKRTKAEQDKVDEQVETDWDKEIAKRRRMDRKAKNEKPKIILEYLDGAKIEWTNGWNDIKSEKKTSYEQGKKDTDNEIKALKRCIEIDTHQQELLRKELKLRLLSDRHSLQHEIDRIKRVKKEVRKQTLSEVLKDLKRTKKMIETYIKPLSEYERGRYEHAWNMILDLEQTLKAME